MTMLRSLKEMFARDPGEPSIVDFVPVTGTPDWRKAKVAEASKRYGKPFACGPDDVAHEVKVGGLYVVKRPSNVTELKRKA